MKIVRIDGGLGNQMFCYAFALALQNVSGEDVLIDTHRYAYFPNHNGYELDSLFNIELKESTKRELWKVTYPAYSLLASRIYQRFPHRRSEIIRDYTEDYAELMTNPLDGYYIGNWQNYRHFDLIEDYILKAFEFKSLLNGMNLQLFNQLNSCNSVSLHIRRGDYLYTPQYCGICDENYYRLSVAKVIELFGIVDHWAIFSNDIQWCIDNILHLLQGGEVSLVDWNNGRESSNDMRLMTACRANIIANSSFSWWGAYLNPRHDKIVIAPNRWINMELDYKIQCDDWICL